MLRHRNRRKVSSVAVGHAVKGALRRSFSLVANVASIKVLTRCGGRCIHRTSVRVASGAFFFPRALKTLEELGRQNTILNVISAGCHCHVRRLFRGGNSLSLISFVVNNRSIGITGPTPRNLLLTISHSKYAGSRILCLNSDIISTLATRTTNISFINILRNVAARRRLTTCPRGTVVHSLLIWFI